LLIGASAMPERTSVRVLYVDVILVLVAAVPVLLAGAPALGYAVGAAAWIVGRVAAAVAERRIAEIGDFRRQIGFGVASSMLRVWALACAIIAAGVAGSRADGLTAALVIFGAFSVYFASSAAGHVAERRRAER
jgi:hypothetical protein